ncbi:TetR/AcrR family transcriptional regulator [Actinoplanes aureus]|jgi:AcrR family transcriptional regulator|uniref:TetR/AcrR family transcriptional regulator n=1 Tax=Actinoplanes aureus TaxID=2792083 RepID=A0A931G2L8_9ACTN|nr:TetR/AcrR family transcriptional regulator [Actinoplanes aureus]MBG0566236.1 TetR/AcrR family transcriptional regulator [Actinoplanes aureus]
MDLDQGLRARLVRTGAELLQSEGHAALSLREIARRAGVSHGAPRRYFPTHLSLLSAIARSGFADLSDQIDAALAAAPPEPRARIAALAGTYLGFAATNRGMFELMFRHDLLQSGYLGLREAGLPLFRLLAGLVAEVRPASGQRPEVTAGVLWAALHGMAELRNWGSLQLATGASDPAPFLDAILTAHLGAAE